MSDQAAIQLVSDYEDPQEAADALLKEALNKHSMDNISCMVIYFTGGG